MYKIYAPKSFNADRRMRAQNYNF